MELITLDKVGIHMAEALDDRDFAGTIETMRKIRHVYNLLQWVANCISGAAGGITYSLIVSPNFYSWAAIVLLPVAWFLVMKARNTLAIHFGKKSLTQADYPEKIEAYRRLIANAREKV